METSTQTPTFSSVPDKQADDVAQACDELLSQFDKRAEALLQLLSERLEK